MSFGMDATMLLESNVGLRIEAVSLALQNSGMVIRWSQRSLLQLHQELKLLSTHYGTALGPK
jgi:hypothetical protein